MNERSFIVKLAFSVALAAASALPCSPMRQSQQITQSDFELSPAPAFPPVIAISSASPAAAIRSRCFTARDRGYRKLIVCHLGPWIARRDRAEPTRALLNGSGRKTRPDASRSGRTDVPRLAAKSRTISMETAAPNRALRIFCDGGRRRRCRTIFLGHHADDLVETFLINFFRGTGAAGLPACARSFARIGNRTQGCSSVPRHLARKDRRLRQSATGPEFRDDTPTRVSARFAIGSGIG